VHIITDSTYCRDAGESRGRSTRKHAGLWTALDGYVRQGFVIEWHHIPREDALLNRIADRISRMARRAMERYNPGAEMAQLLGSEPEPNPETAPRRRKR
jgi:hypothetical protein